MGEEKRLLESSAVLVCVGVGCFLGWMSSLLVRGGVVSGTWGVGGRSQTFDPFFLAATMTAAVVCLVLCLPGRQWRRSIGSRRFCTVLLVLCACALVSTIVLGVVPCASEICCYAFGFAIGLAMGALLMLWLLRLSDFDPLTTVEILLCDVLIALLAYFLIHFSEKVLRVPVLTVSISAVLLIASAGILMFELRGRSEEEVEVGQTGPLLARFMLFSFCTCFTLEFMSVFAVEHNIDAFFLGTTRRFATQSLGCLSCALVVAALLALLIKTKRRPGFIVSVLYRAMVFFLIMGIALVLTQEPALFFASEAVLLLARFLAWVGAWTIALHAAYLYGSDIVGLIGGMLVAQFFGFFLGMLVHMGASELLSSQLFAAHFILGILAVLCVMFLFVFTSRDVFSASKVSVEAEGGKTSLEARCAVAQKRYHLTERETEVLKLLACGRNAVSIQDILCVSYNTVKAHKRNIYMKLDIHSQQELLTLIETI